MGDSALLGHFRSRQWERLGHGVYKPAGQEESAGRRAGLLADLAAWSLVLPSSACFTHVTAASVYGWQLPAVPQDAPVFVAMHEAESSSIAMQTRCAGLDPDGRSFVSPGTQPSPDASGTGASPWQCLLRPCSRLPAT